MAHEEEVFPEHDLPTSQNDQEEEGPIPRPDIEMYYTDKENLELGVKEALDDLEEEVLKNPERMTPEELAEAADDMREGEIEYLERQSKHDDPEVADRAKFVLEIKEDIDELIDEVNKHIKKGDHDIAEKKIRKFLEKTHETLTESNVEGPDVDMALGQMKLLINLDLSLIEAEEEKRSALLTVLSTGIDIVPFVGGLKMMGEGVYGETLDGQKMSGTKRLLHMGEGMFWEVIDVVALVAALGSFGSGGAVVEGGAAATKIGRAAHGAEAVAKAAKGARALETAPRVSKTMTRTGALMRKHGVSGSKEMYRAGRFLVDNPAAEKVVQKGFEKGFERRAGSQTRAAGAIAGKAKEALQSHEEQVRLLVEINDERERLTRILDDIAANMQAQQAAE
ncbi:hypothetical protein HN748_04150 [Candidatus Peregrinibacteria bacterium]|jgi:hypothetical protein|nr:hypothetical protein [Candidatus Peregrinibacteria bacterium]MBT7703402.1 hypothetical protein [Candidatus Peregrinibacteria bacterium]